mgnify:FL=1
MTYQAPIKDMQFVLNNLVGIDGFAQMPAFADTSAELASAMLNEGSRYFNERLAPNNWDANLEGARLENGVVRVPDSFDALWDGFKQTGWLAASFPEEIGGMGLPWAIGACGIEMVNASNMSFGLLPLLTQGALEAILAHGTDEQKQTYAANIASGQWSGTMNLTEPHAGSDVGALRSKAEPQADGSFLITGQKIYITWGEHELAENIVHLVLAREPGAPEGTKGISLFIVPKFLVNPDGSLGPRNDCMVGGLEEKIGIHASPTCVMRYGDNGGAIGWRLGPPNGGMAAMFTMMNNARLGVGVQGIGLADRAYQHALAFAKERVQSAALGSKNRAGVRIIEHPDVRRNLLTMRSQVEAGRGMALLAYASLDKAHHANDEAERAYHNRRVDLLTPLVKSWCTDMAVEVTSIGVQVHGGMGFVEETGAGQYYRDARILPIYEGTNGIQALDLMGRKLAKDRGQGTAELIAEMRKDITRARITNDALVLDLADRFDDAVARLEQTTAWMLQSTADDLFQAAAGATPFLNMWGSVVGAWIMLQRAIVEEDTIFDTTEMEGQRMSADFYVRNILPRAKGYADQVVDGGDALLTMAEDLF